MIPLITIIVFFGVFLYVFLEIWNLEDPAEMTDEPDGYYIGDSLSLAASGYRIPYRTFDLEGIDTTHAVAKADMPLGRVVWDNTEDGEIWHEIKKTNRLLEQILEELKKDEKIIVHPPGWENRKFYVVPHNDNSIADDSLGAIR